MDVNVAARVADAADAGEVLITESTRGCLDATDAAVEFKRKWRFSAAGAPRDLRVYRVTPRA